MTTASPCPIDKGLIEPILAARPRGIALDIDGTISQIVARPQDAIVPEAIRLHLVTLCRKMDLVAIISGRAAGDAKRLVGVEEALYIGSHGLERWQAGRVVRVPQMEPYIERIKQVRRRLEGQLGEGVEIEYKGASISFHYRLSPHPATARDHILQSLQACPEVTSLLISEGRMIVELRPPVPVHKGTALLDLVEEHSLKSIIYIGDDLTDIDAFQAVHTLKHNCAGLAVAVAGAESAPEVAEAADITLPGVEAVEALLVWMAGHL